jgi:hypothetical protein
MKTLVFLILSLSLSFGTGPVLTQDQFSVSVVSSDGGKVPGVQCYVATRDGLFQQGKLDSDGLFVFDKPRLGKSPKILVAGNNHESKSVVYSGQGMVAVTLQSSKERNSSVGKDYINVGGSKEINVYYGLSINAIGFSFSPRSDSVRLSVGTTVNGVDQTGKKFKLWIREAVAPIYLVDYTL